ncbi:MAG: protein translocase subunit SecD [Micrococcales bacterium]|nr:protein translocase subunit SecD [Micrococcales bacterium]MCL2666447.1 protein translocase subunit SecD [Micrococcales bacterium]
MAPPVRRQRPVRTLLFLGVAVFALFAAIGSGVIWSDATTTPKLALDLEGGTELILCPVPIADTVTSDADLTDDTGEVRCQTNISSDDINQAIAIIRQRVDASGVAEAEISSQGGYMIVVGLPGEPKPETLELVSRSAMMEFRPVLLVGTGLPVKTEPPAEDPTPEEGTPTEGAGEEGTTEGTDQTGEEAAAAEPEPEPTDPARPDKPSSASDAAYYITPAVQKEFDELDCSKRENLTGGRIGKPDEAFVTCDLPPKNAKDSDLAALATTGEIGKYILGPVEVEGAQISKASSGLETLQGGGVGTRWVVNLEFNSTGTKQFGDVSKRLLPMTSPQNRFGIVLDGMVVSAPSINAVIPDGRAEISGSFDRTSAATLAQQLNFGSLPVNFQKLSEDRISATLGSEQLQKGLMAGLFGLLLVVVYSFAQYRVLGLLTVGSLGIAAVTTYGVVTLLSWSYGYRLSLAGVGGLIVAIGITADSFIVYFERIRDELRDGRALGAAVEHGWSRAKRTILASDAVNFLAAIVLYVVSVGGVRGFAFTLGLTTLVDLVIVFGFTHPMMQVLAKRRFFAEGHPWSGLDPRRLGVSAHYAGRGRISRPKADRVVSDEPDDDVPEDDVPAPSYARVPGSDDAPMTIAERRAAARKKAVADEGSVD